MACVLALFYVASRWFNAEVGFLASLILLFDKNFVFEHGMRSGTMDTGVTLLVLLTLFFTWKGLEDTARSKNWIIAGLCCGLIGWLKGTPLVAITLMFAGFSGLILGTGKSLYERLRGPALIGLSAGLLLLPYMIFRWWHYGAMDEARAVSRLTGNLHPEHYQVWSYYLQEIMSGSNFI